MSPGARHPSRWLENFVVDDNPSIESQPCLLSEREIRAHTDSRYYEIRADAVSIR
jgi:hypothetical protein